MLGETLRRLITLTLQIIVILFITLALIEGVLQVIFLSLPQAIIQRMPQYQERYGIQFDTPHGAREYPPHEKVDFEVNQFSGDLYQISCLSPKDAVSADPYQVTYTRDSHGFRNPEPWADDIDLAIIGDSFTAAESINTPYWNNLADSMLVFGLPGSGTIEQSLLFKHFALTRNPETVILAYFGGNDLSDNVIFHDLQQENLTFADKTHQNRTLLDYLVTFHLALFVRDSLSQASNDNCPYPINGQTQPPTPLAFYDGMVSLFTIGETELQYTQAFTITQTKIIELAESVKASEADFVLMYIPQKAEMYWHYLDTETQQTIMENLPINPLVDQTETDRLISEENIVSQRNILQLLANEYEFTFLDTTPFLIEATDQGLSPYFFADTHWNQTGHDIVHKVLVEFLASSSLNKNLDS